jgi:hypothetical protein
MLELSVPSPWSMAKRSIVAVVTSAIVAVMLLVMARRLTGGLVTPLSFFPAACVGLVIVALAWVLRTLAHLSSRAYLSMLTRAAIAAPWLLLFAVSLSGTSALAVLVLWLPLIAFEVGWQTQPQWRSGGAWQWFMSSSPAVVTQQWSRVVHNGVETVSGTVQAVFEPLEQTTAVHISFVPAFQQRPRVEATVDRDDISVRITDSFPYGLRAELRVRVSANARRCCTLHFTASSPWSSTREH